MKPSFLLCTAFAALAACNAPPPLNFTPNNVGLSQTKHNASLVKTTVTIASKEEAKGKIDAAGAEAGVAMLWQTALEDAMVRMALFKDDAPIRLSLVVKILELDMAGAGFTMKSSSIARYELIDRNSGDIVFTTDIETDGRSPAGEDFMGANRARHSINRAVQNNIAVFLQQLETADLTKPLFPANQSKN